jgi:hypothetical protein
MIKSHLKIFLVFFIAVITIHCNNKKPKEEYFTGLILATQEELNKIPLATAPVGAVDLPQSVDLSADLPPVGYQGTQNSCVGWASAYALKSFQEKVELKTTTLFSPSFIYNQRIDKSRDVGMSIIDALNIISDQGVAKLEDMPYNETDNLTQPSQIAKENAKPFRIEGWRKVNILDIKEVRAQINAFYPVVIAVALDEGFKAAKPNVGNSFVWKEQTGNFGGYHAMLVVGYDNSLNAFKVLNSWGNSWANNGYCWIDYNFFPKVVREGYIAKDAVTPNTNTNTNTNTNNNTIPNNNTVIDNKPIVENPEQYAKANLTGVQVQHNVQNPTYGNCMKISGYIDIPAGFGKTFQLSNHFYYSNTTTQIGSLQSPQFADVNGYAATGTILYSVPPQGLNNWYFEVFMPYTAFNIAQGSYVNGTYQYQRTNMYAIPTLFIDNFGYAKGDAIVFYVDK